MRPEIWFPSTITLLGLVLTFLSTRRALANDRASRADENKSKDRTNDREEFDSIEAARVNELGRMEQRLTRVEQRLALAIKVIRADRAAMTAAGLSPEPLPVELLGADT